MMAYHCAFCAMDFDNNNERITIPVNTMFKICPECEKEYRKVCKSSHYAKMKQSALIKSESDLRRRVGADDPDGTKATVDLAFSMSNNQRELEDMLSAISREMEIIEDNDEEELDDDYSDLPF